MKIGLFLFKKNWMCFFVLFSNFTFGMEVPKPPISSTDNMDMFPEENISSTNMDLTLTPTVLPAEERQSMQQTDSAMEFVNKGADTEKYLEKEIGTQGNWVKKREWLKEAQKINDEIQNLAETIQKTKESFYGKFKNLDDELDKFYKQQGFEQGQLQTLFNDIEKYLEKKRNKEIEILKQRDRQRGITGEYEIKLDILEDEIRSQKMDLEQLQLDMNTIADLDKGLSERLKKLDEYIDMALKEASSARKLVNKIWYILDDKKARTVYYELKGNILEKMLGIQKYIQQDLLQNFDNIISSIRSQISRVTIMIDNLENKGFIIKDRARRVEEFKLKELERLREEKKEVEVKKPEKIEQISFIQKIYEFMVDIIAKTYVWFDNLFSYKKNEDAVRETVKKQMNEKESMKKIPEISTPERLPSDNIISKSLPLENEST
ncbi:hypothetical protein GF322_01230 [Candidatus Dependentiae bacterium]|nr:hypothetical protein [Candidatus Dependentiae bacterium]